VPTLEALAAVDFLRAHFPELKIRFVNVVDLMTLQPQSEHPHGLSDRDFDSIFTTNKPVIFAFHGYPWLVHRLTYRRTNHPNLHVRGYKEEGTTTTPFDMVVLNDLDRFHLAQDVIDRVPHLTNIGGHVKQIARDKLTQHKRYIVEQGRDMPEVEDWKWGYYSGSHAPKQVVLTWTSRFAPIRKPALHTHHKKLNLKMRQRNLIAICQRLPLQHRQSQPI
jgi:xylulose-5-phosphate/fructose-6-phosphate phosphoketolase